VEEKEKEGEKNGRKKEKKHEIHENWKGVKRNPRCTGTKEKTKKNRASILPERVEAGGTRTRHKQSSKQPPEGKSKAKRKKNPDRGSNGGTDASNTT